MITKFYRSSRSCTDSRLGLSLADTMKRFAMLTPLVWAFIIGVIVPPRWRAPADDAVSCRVRTVPDM